MLGASQTQSLLQGVNLAPAVNCVRNVIGTCRKAVEARISDHRKPPIVPAGSLLQTLMKNPKFPIHTLGMDVQKAIELAPQCLPLALSEAVLKANKWWNISHVSAPTFFENKNRFPEAQLKGTSKSTTTMLWDISYATATAAVRQLSSQKSNWVLNIQRRHFRTERKAVLDEVRGTSVGDRLRSNLKSYFQRHEKTKLVSTEARRSETLKALMNEEGMTPEEQRRILVAFSEGYMAADPTKQQSRTGRFLKVFQQVLAILVFLALLISLVGTSSGSMFRVHVGNGNEVHPEEIKVTFDDVKGAEEAKQELLEIVEFLKNPEKFSSLGGKLPKGVLLVGPPGTGKTLLARAVAGEAGVPFFHAAGSEFDEVLVGQGARRIRDLFKAAKLRAPCVIFIDEIDSVGAKRTNSVLHPYANQTINQLLSEMDGFHQNEGVIVLGATNRREDLDKALLRPGRFDVEVQVHIPDYTGRQEILTFYLEKITTAEDVDVNLLARGTTGFTGADIENLVNQAAVRAAIDSAEAVSMKHLENARDKVLMGPERKTRIPDEEANLITAYHEGGHAIVAHYTKDAIALHKVTIIPRGPSLGHTAYIPVKERYHVTKAQLLASMDTMMGGRAAEELIFGADKVTSGASSDLKQATEIAKHMVRDLGMSEKVGLRTMDSSSKAVVSVNELSEATSEVVDSEISRLLRESYERAKHILKTHEREHKLLAEALMKYETLDADDVKSILSRPKDGDR